MNNKISYRRLIALLAIGAGITLVPQQASAVRGLAGLSSQTFCVKNPAVNDTWLTPINNGRNAWNSHASFPGTISLSTSCANTILVGSYGFDWLGQNAQSGGISTIKLDSSNLNSHIASYGYTFANVVKSTTAHELGHSLRLGDHSDQPTKLMSSARNRNTVTGPTTAEVVESNGYF